MPPYTRRHIPQQACATTIRPLVAEHHGSARAHGSLQRVCSRAEIPVTSAKPNDSSTGVSQAADSDSSKRSVAEPTLAKKLERWGAAGVAAYGVLNTIYYACAIAVAWVYIFKVDRGIGLQQGSRMLLKVGASAWALSQLTKVPRVLGALIMAPATDSLLAFLARRCRLRGKGQAVWVLVGACLLLFACVVATLLVSCL